MKKKETTEEEKVRLTPNQRKDTGLPEWRNKAEREKLEILETKKGDNQNSNIIYLPGQLEVKSFSGLMRAIFDKTFIEYCEEHNIKYDPVTLEPII